MTRFLTILVFIVFLSNCKDSPFEEDDIEIPLSGVHSELNLIHNSHFNENDEITPYGFSFVLSLQLILERDFDKNTIHTVSISDKEAFEQEFSKEQLDNLFSNSVNGFRFNDLILEEESFSSLRRFLITLFDENDLILDEFSINLHPKVPYPANTQNFWVSSTGLEIEHSVNQEYYSSSSTEGFDLIHSFEDAYTYWLDENFDKIDSASIFKENVYQDDNDFFHTQNNVPENAAFYYNSFSIIDSTFTQSLTTALQTINEKLPEGVTFYDIPGEHHNIIAVTETLLIGTSYDSTLNKLNTVFITDKNTGELISEFKIFENLNQQFAPVLYDESQNLIFYINEETELSQYNLNTNTHKSLVQIRKFWWDYNIFYFGDKIAITIADYVVLYDRDKNALFNNETLHSANAFPAHSNTSYYSDTYDALLFYPNNHSNEAFKLTTNPKTNLFNPFEYLNLRPDASVTGFSPGDNRKFHFNERDSVLIHSSGAIIDLTKINDFANSKISPSKFGAISSAWSQKDQVLAVVDYFRSVTLYSFSNNSLTEKENIQTFFTITDSYYDNGEFKIVGHYPSHNSPNRSVVIHSLSVTK